MSSRKPKTLAGRTFTFDREVAARIAAATSALARFDARTHEEHDATAYLLRRAEALASSRIDAASDPFAYEAHLEMLATATSPAAPITPDRLVELNWRLLVKSHSAGTAGALRHDAPAAALGSALADLCAFCCETRVPAIAQAALAYAGFVAIRPFAEGNGPTGRALAMMVLRSRGVAVRSQPPISVVFAGRPLEHARLTGDTRARTRAAWAGFFADAVTESVAATEGFVAEVASLQSGWRARVSERRKDATVFALIDALVALPIVTTGAAARMTGRTFAAANGAVAALVAANVLRPLPPHRSRNRSFDVPELEAALAAFAGTTAPSALR